MQKMEKRIFFVESRETLDAPGILKTLGITRQSSMRRFSRYRMHSHGSQPEW